MLSDSKSPPFGAVGKRAATCEEWASDEEDREESEPVRRRDPAGQDFGEHGLLDGPEFGGKSVDK